MAKNRSLMAGSLMFVAILSQAGLAFGGLTPLTQGAHVRTIEASSQDDAAPSAAPASPLDQWTAGDVTVPVIELAAVPSQVSAPAPVPLPAALETGLSGGAALVIAAGLRRLRRLIRRGF